MEKKFKCKDEVIYRFKGVTGLEDPDPWTYGIFSHYINNEDIVVNGNCYRANLTDILPYEGNEHLVGTDLPADEEARLEKGEIIICSDYLNRLSTGTGILERYKAINGISFHTHGGVYEYAIRFSDFNPNDMEETRKHILVVRNGKIVRYKG